MSSPKPTCHLYNSAVQRIMNELAEAGIASEAHLSVDQLLQFDQMHYAGVKALDLAAERVGLKPGAKLLDVGSGFGGPARYFASKYDVQVVALELQQELSEFAQDLCERTETNTRVKNVCGSVTEIDNAKVTKSKREQRRQQQQRAEEEGGGGGSGEEEERIEFENCFDGCVGFLVFLHIPDRQKAWRVVFDSLKPGGVLFVEDFFVKQELTENEKEAARSIVGCAEISKKEALIGELEKAGFRDIEFDDCSDEWTPWVEERANKFSEEMTRNRRVHGDIIAEEMLEFYQTVATLFKGGNMGGARIRAVKAE